MILKRWLTEYTGTDGERYAGPIIVDESLVGATAILSCLLGPNGQGLRLIGELVKQVVVGEDLQSTVRRAL